MTPEELDALREQLVALGDDTETRARRIAHSAHWLARHVPDLLRLLAHIDELQARISEASEAIRRVEGWLRLADEDDRRSTFDRIVESRRILAVLRERMGAR
jgi:hypothetical protein